MSSRVRSQFERVEIVEYLRGLAALSVTWFHLTNSYPQDWVRNSGSFGWLGVDVFFVISGFVIPLSMSRMAGSYGLRQFPQFMVRRIVRLEPPYLISIALALALWWLSSMVPGFQGMPPTWNIGQISAHILYLIPLTDYGWIQPVYWSLAWEFVFYVIMGLSFPLVAGPKDRAAWYLVVSIVLGLVLVGWLPFRAGLFVMGVAIYRSEGKNPGQLEAIAVVVASALVIANWNPAVAVVGGTTATLIHFSRRYSASGIARRWLIGLGAVSYALYLTHVPVGGRIVNLGRRVVETPVQEFMLSLLALIVCVAFAWIYWKFVEQPFVALAKRLSTSGPKEAVSPGS